MKIEGLKDTIDWYDKNAERYAKDSESYLLPYQLDDFAALLPKGASVLDAGCGPGRDCKRVSEKGFKVTGVDLSEGLLSIAKKNVPEANFVQGDIRQLPFEDSEFSGVMARASLLHLETVEDAIKSLAEMNRVLEKDGILSVLVKAQTGDKKFDVVSDKLSGHNRFFQFFTKDELIGLLIDSGFEVVSSEQYKESDKLAHGRQEVEWIFTLAKKV